MLGTQRVGQRGSGGCHGAPRKGSSGREWGLWVEHAVKVSVNRKALAVS